MCASQDGGFAGAMPSTKEAKADRRAAPKRLNALAQRGWVPRVARDEATEATVGALVRRLRRVLSAADRTELDAAWADYCGRVEEAPGAPGAPGPGAAAAAPAPGEGQAAAEEPAGENEPVRLPARILPRSAPQAGNLCGSVMQGASQDGAGEGASQGDLEDVGPVALLAAQVCFSWRGL